MTDPHRVASPAVIGPMQRGAAMRGGRRVAPQRARRRDRQTAAQLRDGRYRAR